jgi:hypothetical protein
MPLASLRARHLLAVLLALHGAAHLAGTGDALRRAADGGAVGFLGGRWTVSDPVSLRALGILWAVAALGFVATAVITWKGRAIWPRVLWWVALVSLALVVIALWTSIVGVAVDAVLLVVARRSGALRPVASHG